MARKSHFAKISDEIARLGGEIRDAVARQEVVNPETTERIEQLKKEHSDILSDVQRNRVLKDELIPAIEQVLEAHELRNDPFFPREVANNNRAYARKIAYSILEKACGSCSRRNNCGYYKAPRNFLLALSSHIKLAAFHSVLKGDIKTYYRRDCEAMLEAIRSIIARSKAKAGQ